MSYFRFLRFCIIVGIAILLSSCGTTKTDSHRSSNKIIHDTVIKVDTVHSYTVGSTYKKRYKEALNKLEESNDSVVITKYKDRIVTQKFGNSLRQTLLEKQIDSLTHLNTEYKDKISSLRELHKSKEQTTENNKKKRSGFNIWKWGFILTWIAIAVLMISKNLGIRFKG